MRRVLARAGGVALLVFLAALPIASQVPALRIISATPTGELTTLADADQIRILFSEPMVAVGTVPSGTKPEWITMTPALAGSFYWSGTKTLMFSPNSEAPVPYATRVVVRVAPDATSQLGHALGAPYEFTFTTPTVRLVGANWQRKNGRFDEPAVIALRFNQPVRPADVVAHLQVLLTPHGWNMPTMSAAALAYLAEKNPTGLAQDEAKRAAMARVMNERRNRLAAVVASSWDERWAPPAPEQVVIEVAQAPTDAWLTLAVDASLPSPAGPETHAAQSTVVRLEPTLVMLQPACTADCAPSRNNAIGMSRDVSPKTIASSLVVTDVTDASRERRIDPIRTLSDDEVYFGFRNQLASLGFAPQPAMTRYRYELPADLIALDGQTLGYPWVEFVEAIHESPYLSIGGSVWEANGGPAIPIATRNLTSITQRIGPIAPASLLSTMAALRRSGINYGFSLGTASARDLTIVPDIVQAQGLDVRAALGTGGNGLVWIGASAGLPLRQSAATIGTTGLNAGALVQVTNLGLTVKDSPESTLIFVTSLDRGQPVPQARVAIMNPEQTLWAGLTDADGLAKAPALSLRTWNRSPPWAFVVTAAKDDDFAYVEADWSGDTQPYSWGLSYRWPATPVSLSGVAFTDRGAYKVGDTVHIKAVLRDNAPTGVRLLPFNGDVDVTVHDSRNTVVDRRTLQAGRWSSVDWEWTIPAESALGSYRIQITRSGLSDQSPDVDRQRVFGSFMVAAYRRPDFRVDATLDAESAVMGSTLKGGIEAKYLFGSPLASRPVRWFVRRSPMASVPQPIHDRFREEQYAFGYSPNLESLPDEPYRLIEKTTTLGADGKVSVDLQTSAERDFAYAYMFEGDVEDVSGQHIANRAFLIVHPAAFYVGLTRPTTFVDTKVGATIGVVVADLKGQAIANIPITLQLFREEWVYSQPGPGIAPRNGPWQRKEIPAGEWRVRSAATDVPVPISVKDGGRYILRATARDAEQRPTRTDVSFYATGPGKSFWRTDGNRIELAPERDTWKPGETARILVQSPWETATALVTTEREGIRSHRRIDIRSTQDTIGVPITEADIPNLFVSVVLVKGRTAADPSDVEDLARPAYRVGYTELTVDSSSKRLQVEVSTDKAEYRPRAPAQVSVVVKKPEGTPVRGEVTLWAMDYGLLSLTSYTTPDVLDSIYARKPLQVMTEDNRSRLIGRKPLANDFSDAFRSSTISGLPQDTLNITIDGVLGQQGQTGDGFVSSTIDAEFIRSLPRQDHNALNFLIFLPGIDGLSEIRTDFRSLVFWLGSITTDANGRATTNVTLPDSLTTYRIMAVAGNDASQFGYGEHEIQVSKPLAMLPAFPRFMSRGDKAAFGAVVTNTGKTGGQAVVTIRSLDPETLEFDGDVSRTFTLAPGASEPVRFDATARAMGLARVQVIVKLGTETDAFETSLPVTIPTRLETTAAYGDTTSSAIEKIALPAGLLPRAGGLTVDLASTALVGLGESARYVQEYPFECAEQKASRALALILAADLGGAFNMNIKPEEYRATAVRALNELHQYQCGDGGFSLWPGECQTTSAYLTAYVLHVMKVASTLKVTPDQYSVDRGLSYLRQSLRTPPPEVQWHPVWSASQAYAVKVLAEFGNSPRADIARLAGMTERLPVFAMSYLADAMAATNERGPSYEAVIARLKNSLRVEADRAHVEEIDDDALSWVWNSNPRATAVVLDGLSRRKDDDTLVAPLVRWLLAARTNGRWGTTHENAMALEALVSYYKAFESDTPNMTATVTLGVGKLGTAAFKGRSTTAQQVRVAMPDLIAKVGAAATAPDLTITRTGTGKVFYTARVQYLAPESPEAADRGFHVERRYERYVEDAKTPGRAMTSFEKGDLVRVTVRVTLRGEGRYLALTDPIPAGFETIDSWFNTTASDLARQATRTLPGNNDWLSWWRRGVFDHVEKHDDRVQAFATRLSSGRHEFSYLVRATTSGTFTASGARLEAMYAPEVSGRSAASTVVIR